MLVATMSLSLGVYLFWCIISGVTGKVELDNEMIEKSLLNQIVNLLKTNKIEYRQYEHEPVFNSETAAKVIGARLEEGAKALILLGDNKSLMVVVSGTDRVDFKKFKDLSEIKKLEMATPKEVKRISGVEIGAVPPFGNLFNIPLYIDRRLETEKEIVFSAGSHSISIRMKYSDFKNITNPIVGNFAK